MKKIISCILAILMCFSCFGIISFAEETTSEHLTTVPGGYIGVYTVEDLYCVRNDLTANYILMNDIDLSDVTAEGGDWNFGGRGWNPIGSNDTYSNLLFEGIFDGNGYSITGMNMNIELQGANKTEFYIGLFSSVSGTVKNLTVGGKIQLDLSLSTKFSNPINVYVGSIAAYSRCGVFEKCINKTEIIVNEELTANGRSYTFSIGGIVGRTDSMSDDSFANSTHVSRCLNMGKINVNVCNYYEENNYVAGIVGYSAQVNAVIEKCINTADVYIGAIPKGAYLNSVHASGIANANSVNIINCYNTANITAVSTVMSRETSYAAGICADGGTSFCYNVGLIEAGLREYPIGPVDSTNKPTGKSYYLSGVGASQVNDYCLELTNAQMKLQSMYSGWDFDTVWTMEGRADYPYPELRDVELYFPGEDPDHEHSYTGMVTTPATHLAEGVMTYTCACGDSYTEVIAKIPDHTYNAVVTAPTCTEEGYTTYTCVCGDSYVADYVKENGHSYTSEITTPATHLTEGVMAYTCACGDSYTEVIAKIPDHTYNAVVTAPTCTEEGYTTYTCACGDSYVADYVKENGHSYTSEITTPATHLTEGVMTYTCACGDIYTEAIAKIPEHTYNAVVTAPTCTEEGYTTYTCVCGDSYVADYVKENGHSYTSEITTPATHLKEGVVTYTCACGDSYTEAIVKTPKHTYSTDVIAPTCTEQGFTVYTCECGDSYKGDFVDTVEHNDNDGDEYCDYCDDFLGTEDEENKCTHMCHKSGIMGFIWKILNFFCKLFGINPVCECGRAHY